VTANRKAKVIILGGGFGGLYAANALGPCSRPLPRAASYVHTAISDFRERPLLRTGPRIKSHPVIRAAIRAFSGRSVFRCVPPVAPADPLRLDCGGFLLACCDNTLQPRSFTARCRAYLCSGQVVGTEGWEADAGLVYCDPSSVDMARGGHGTRLGSCYPWLA
jgi:hypothetical protein